MRAQVERPDRIGGTPAVGADHQDPLLAARAAALLVGQHDGSNATGLPVDRPQQQVRPQRHPRRPVVHVAHQRAVEEPHQHAIDREPGFARRTHAWATISERAAHTEPPMAQKIDPRAGRDWRGARRALRALLRDPERTDAVFDLIEALNRRQDEKALAKYAADPRGRRLLAERPDLLAALVVCRTVLPAQDLAPVRVFILAGQSNDYMHLR